MAASFLRMTAVASVALACAATVAAAADPDARISLDLGGESDPLEFIYVGPGTFRMGFKEDKPFQRRDDGQLWSVYSDPWAGTALPVHEVTITRGYYLGQFEVTRGQFAAFVEDTNFKTQADREGFSMGGLSHGDWKKIEGSSWADPKAFAQEDSHPVTCIGWHDAVAFCAWASEETGWKVRLPAEAEWEFACRAGTETQWHSGGWPPGKHLQTVSWHMGRYVPGWKPACGTLPVGSRKPNAWGFHDMHGNVWEWCSDYYKLYPSGPRTDPHNKDFPGVQYWHEGTKDFVKAHWAEHNPTNGRRVLRGGSWCSQAPGNRSGFRRHEKGTNHLWYFGFRVVAEKPDQNELAGLNARRQRRMSTPEAVARGRARAEEERKAKAADEVERSRAARADRFRTKRERDAAIAGASTAWDAKLLGRVRETLAAGGTVRFNCVALRGRGRVRSVDGGGRIVVADRTGQMVLPLVPALLSYSDRAALARAALRAGNKADAALAAFYSLAAGETDRGAELLHAAGEAGSDVRALFESLGDR